jgi:hypothetical protein
VLRGNSKHICAKFGNAMALWRLGRKEEVVWYSMYFTNNPFDTVSVLFNKDYNGSIRFSHYPEATISDCIELALRSRFRFCNENEEKKCQMRRPRGLS